MHAEKTWYTVICFPFLFIYCLTSCSRIFYFYIFLSQEIIPKICNIMFIQCRNWARWHFEYLKILQLGTKQSNIIKNHFLPILHSYFWLVNILMSYKGIYLKCSTISKNRREENFWLYLNILYMLVTTIIEYLQYSVSGYYLEGLFGLGLPQGLQHSICRHQGLGILESF